MNESHPTTSAESEGSGDGYYSGGSCGSTGDIEDGLDMPISPIIHIPDMELGITIPSPEITFNGNLNQTFCISPNERRESLLRNFDPLSQATATASSTTSYDKLEEMQPTKETEDEISILNHQEIILPTEYGGVGNLIQIPDNIRTERNNIIDSPPTLLFENTLTSKNTRPRIDQIEPSTIPVGNLLMAGGDEGIDFNKRQHLQDQLKEQEDRLKELESMLAKTTLNDNLDNALIGYEKKMSEVVREVDDAKLRILDLEQENLELVRDRDQSMEDLRNSERAFTDIHGKYERLKNLLRASKENVEILKARDIEMQERLDLHESRFTEIETEVNSKLTRMYSDYERRYKAQEFETSRLKAQLRKLEMKNETLESEIQQKTLEMNKLHALCDELINQKMG